MDDKKIMAENIRRLMQEKGVNQKEVCEALCIKQPTFSDWINGKTYPRIDKINMLAKYFGVDNYELTEPHSKIDKLNRFRAQLDEYEHFKDAFISFKENDYKFLMEYEKMNTRKRDLLLAYMRALNDES